MKIVFFSCEPGGAEVLIPVIQHLIGFKTIEIEVWGFGLALPRFIREKIIFKEIAPVELPNISLLKEAKPDLLITSATSLPQKNMSEKYLWKQAGELNIPSIAFLDQWQNYTIRFSGPESDERLKYLPDYINCIDSNGFEEMKNEGFPAHILKQWGQPYLSKQKEIISQLSQSEIMSKVGFSAKIETILFVSEEIRDNYGISLGYDQYDVLEKFVSFVNSQNEEKNYIIKLHPKENLENYMQIFARVRCSNFKVITTELNSQEVLIISDKVYGMSSIMLIEAFVLGKEVFSVQPSLKVKDPFFLSRSGIIPRLEDFTLIFNPISKFLPSFEYKKEEFFQFILSIVTRREI